MSTVLNRVLNHVHLCGVKIRSNRKVFLILRMIENIKQFLFFVIKYKLIKLNRKTAITCLKITNLLPYIGVPRIFLSTVFMYLSYFNVIV